MELHGFVAVLPIMPCFSSIASFQARIVTLESVKLAVCEKKVLYKDIG